MLPENEVYYFLPGSLDKSVIGMKDVVFISHPKSEDFYQGYKKLNQNLDKSLR